MSRIVRFGAGALADLGDVAAELGLERLLLVTSRRGAEAVGELPVAVVFDGVRSHVPVETVQAAASLARERGVDGLVGLGGGSAIDTCKAVSAELLPERELRTIAVPTTYAGAEWTSFYGMLLSPGRKGGGSAERTKPIAAIYDPTLSVSLALTDTVGTAMNALAHCAEAYYTPARPRSPMPCHSSPTGPTGSTREHAYSRAPFVLPSRSKRPGSLLATPWRRRSAAATGFRRAR